MHIRCTAARFDDKRMTINQNELQNRKKNRFLSDYFEYRQQRVYCPERGDKEKNLLHLIDFLGDEFVETVQVYLEKRNINRRVFSSKPLDRSLAVGL